MSKMYANSRFKKKINEWGQVEEWIEPGDEISQSDINVSDEEWQSLIDRGVVVEEYPQNIDSQTPLAEYYRQNPDEMRESTVDESTPSVEAMPKTETAEARGEKMPGQDDAEKNQEGEQKQPWQK